MFYEFLFAVRPECIQVRLCGCPKAKLCQGRPGRPASSRQADSAHLGVWHGRSHVIANPMSSPPAPGMYVRAPSDFVVVSFSSTRRDGGFCRMRFKNRGVVYSDVLKTSTPPRPAGRASPCLCLLLMGYYKERKKENTQQTRTVGGGQRQGPHMHEHRILDGRTIRAHGSRGSAAPDNSFLAMAAISLLST